MRYFLSVVFLTLIFGASTRVSATQNADACIETLRARLAQIEDLDTIYKHSNKYIDKQLAKQQKVQDEQWADWMKDFGKQLKSHAKDIKQLLKSKLSAAELAEACKTMNVQFLALQQANADESRRFMTLSNAAKTRHDTAKNAIANIR